MISTANDWRDGRSQVAMHCYLPPFLVKVYLFNVSNQNKSRILIRFLILKNNA